jgi:hypothetical protein
VVSQPNTTVYIVMQRQKIDARQCVSQARRKLALELPAAA